MVVESVVVGAYIRYMSANMVYTRSICCLPSSLQSGASLVLTGGVVFLIIPSHCLKGKVYNGIHAFI